MADNLKKVKVPQSCQPWAWPGRDDNFNITPRLAILKFGNLYVIYDDYYILFGGL